MDSDEERDLADAAALPPPPPLPIDPPPIVTDEEEEKKKKTGMAIHPSIHRWHTYLEE